MPVRFFQEDVKIAFSRKRLRDVIQFIGLVEQKQIGDVNVILVTDDRLLAMNQQHLGHNYYTDIVTFQYTSLPHLVSGDLFISADRVRENAIAYQIEFSKELSRVVIHGILHLCGYKDKKPRDKTLMRKKETFYLDSMLFL